MMGRLGFANQEVAALLGAHSLGRALMQDSGYQGQWTTRGNTLSNEYYKTLLGYTWYQTGLPNGRTQYQTDQAPNFMLDTDVSLVWVNEDPNNDQCLAGNDGGSFWSTYSGGSQGARLGPHSGNSRWCAVRSDFASNILTYAQDNDKWLWDFGLAVQKLSEFGNSNLRPTCSDDDTDPGCNLVGYGGGNKGPVAVPVSATPYPSSNSASNYASSNYASSSSNRYASAPTGYATSSTPYAASTAPYATSTAPYATTSGSSPYASYGS